jgi:hypothetical protein
VLLVALFAFGNAVSQGWAGVPTGTDPTLFAPRCLNPLHRSFRECLDAHSVGGVTLTGLTRAGNSSRDRSPARSVDMLSGQEYEFSLNTPPMCPEVMKTPQPPCTVSINWAPLYGASWADWGLAVQRTLQVVPYLGCEGNDRECDFSVDYADPGGPFSLPDGTALRVTAVADVYGLPCGTAKVGYCYHWVDWPLRLANSTPEPGEPAKLAPPAEPVSTGPPAPPGTVGTITAVSGKVYVQRQGTTKLESISDGTFIQTGDVIVTTPGSSVQLSFSLGGRAAATSGESVTVAERTVVGNEETTSPLYRFFGGELAKLKEPLEISPNGPGSGIKG